METLTVSSSLLAPISDSKPLTPAMLAVLWVIADELDRKRVPAKVADAVWLEIPSKKLRGEGGRSDNVWLRECLERLTGIKLSGRYRESDWVAVMVAEAHIAEGGALTRILVPPAAIHAMRAPETFAKLEYHAAFKLTGHARKLYALLADKKRMGRPSWTYELSELRSVLDVQTKKSYERFNNFRQWVLDPALAEINDFGTVHVEMTPERVGRAVKAVRFDWRWKTLDEARETDEENERLDMARRKSEAERDAAPLSEWKEPPFDRDEWQHWLTKNPGGKMSDYLADKRRGVPMATPAQQRG